MCNGLAACLWRGEGPGGGAGELLTSCNGYPEERGNYIHL